MRHPGVVGTDGEFPGVFERQIRSQRQEVTGEDQEGGESEGQPIHLTEERLNDRARGRVGLHDKVQRKIGETAEPEEREGQEEEETPGPEWQIAACASPAQTPPMMALLADLRRDLGAWVEPVGPVEEAAASRGDFGWYLLIGGGVGGAFPLQRGEALLEGEGVMFVQSNRCSGGALRGREGCPTK